MKLPSIPPELLSRISNETGCDALNAAVEYGELCARAAKEEAAMLCERIWWIDGELSARQFAKAIREDWTDPRSNSAARVE